MDQIKIGAFIAECRKKRGWTQNQLAEQLGLTGKAVSKWETGRSMPDLSLFSSLCSLLEISVNELMAGAYISEEELRSKTDEVLMEVITNWLGQEERERKASGDKSERILKVSNVSKIYETENRKTLAVDDVSFEVQQGSFVGIMGKSGSGKTTLLNLIATIDKPTDGKVDIGGQIITDLSESKRAQFRREHLGFIFQEYNLLDTLTIYENIALA
ncbi:MAG: ATP-binding cassette domain-containing protein, partial [Lachnospiraceae bacterium]|nr:ATP-binding cassette domain-containing protein [Lachnospiraceae bacterium]